MEIFYYVVSTVYFESLGLSSICVVDPYVVGDAESD